jgi:prevent-host-death family protein
MQNVRNLNYQQKLARVITAMETVLGVTKAREKLSEIVESVQYQNDTYIISRHGRPAAAVVPVEVYESWKQRRKEFFDLVREFQEASGESDPGEVMQEVLQAQMAVRSQEET